MTTEKEVKAEEAQAEKYPVEQLVTPEFSFYHDWDSFIFWRHMNWRDFTFIHLSFETGPNRWYDVQIAFLGLHFSSQWLRGGTL